MQGNANYNDQPRSTGKNLQRLIKLGNESEDLSTLESAQRSQMGEPKCKIHYTEDIKAFCKDCLCSICFKCLLGEHRNHDIVMLEELSVADLQGKVGQFQDKVEDQIIKLGSMREKIGSIKENYDKKFDKLFTQFKEIERLFLNGFFEQETLGDLKNGKHRQESIMVKVTQILDKLDKLKKEVSYLKKNKQEWDFYTFEFIRSQLD